MRIVQEHQNVLVYDFDVSEGWEQTILLSSDRHHDNVLANHHLETQHLEEAKRRKARILDFGDLHCAMQGKKDRRGDKDQLRPELVGNNYADLLTEYNYNYYQKYEDMFDLLCYGNHETGFRKHGEVDLTKNLADRMKVRVGAYAGWIRFRFRASGSCWSRTLYYNHGYGGGGAVTKGVIQTNRMTAYLSDADIVVTGHTHDQYILPIVKTSLNDSDMPVTYKQWHVKCGGYKEEFLVGDGFHNESGREPKPLGAAWLKFYLKPGDLSNHRMSFNLQLTDE